MPVGDGPAAHDGQDGPVAGGPDPHRDRATCARCGTGVAERPPGWSLQVEPRGTAWLCDGCTRRHLRAIEARLDVAWW